MDVSRLSEYGLDRRIIGVVREMGIVSLYPPQVEGLKKALCGENLVVAVPTASGKSLIAYLTLLQAVMNGGRGLYLVPLKALAQEKYSDLCSFSSLGVRVGLAMGDVGEVEQGLEDCDIIVATSEKADSMLRRDRVWSDGLSVVVVDEIHLLHDPGRGPTLEVLLARLRGMHPNIQVIGLSATISNALDISIWLDAALVESRWRPVDLREGVYAEGVIRFLDGGDREVFTDLGRRSVIESLVLQTVEEGGQVLVFVSSRKSAESLALRISKTLSKLVEEVKRPDILMNSKGEKYDDDVDDVNEMSSLDKKLFSCMEGGAAFHHAGLSARQRRMVEESFRNGVIRCVTATPTLAAGINMPARRVVVRDLKRYDPDVRSTYIPVLEIKQMMGRAGRPGLDPYGEAVLVARSVAEAEYVRDRYLLSDPEPITSKLENPGVLRRHVLGLAATGECRSMKTLFSFLENTFYASTIGTEALTDDLDEAVEFLSTEGFLECDSVNGEFKVTLFGKRTSDLYLDPLSAVKMRDALLSTRGGKKATPFGIFHTVAACPDMMGLYTSSGDMETLEGLVEEHREEFLLPIPEDEMGFAIFLAEVKTAGMLMAWIEEANDDEIQKTFRAGPGDVHARVETARWLVHAMEAMARIFSPAEERRIRQIARRVEYGVKEQLLPLVEVSGIGRRRARILWDNGIKDPLEIKMAGVDRIASLPGFGPKLARKILENV